MTLVQVESGTKTLHIATRLFSVEKLKITFLLVGSLILTHRKCVNGSGFLEALHLAGWIVLLRRRWCARSGSFSRRLHCFWCPLCARNCVRAMVVGLAATKQWRENVEFFCHDHLTRWAFDTIMWFRWERERTVQAAFACELYVFII